MHAPIRLSISITMLPKPQPDHHIDAY